jgi:hypothetical protein
MHDTNTKIRYNKHVNLLNCSIEFDILKTICKFFISIYIIISKIIYQQVCFYKGIFLIKNCSAQLIFLFFSNQHQIKIIKELHTKMSPTTTNQAWLTHQQQKLINVQKKQSD